MKGEVPFEEPVQEGSRLRYYGVYLSKRGPRSFITKTERDIPRGTKVLRTTMGSAQAVELSTQLLLDFIHGKVANNYTRGQGLELAELAESHIQREKMASTFDGRVGHHSDGDKVHTLIALSVEEDDVVCLLLTSNPLWNPYTRRLSKEEAVFVGWPRGNTFLAPVYRSLSEVFWTDRYFPDHRVDDLRKEFFPPERIAHIRTL